MSQNHLDFFSLITTIIAPILALFLAILSTFADTRHEVEIKDKDRVVKKKVLTRYGKILLVLMIIAAGLTLSGKFVEEQQKELAKIEQERLDSLGQVRRDSILRIAQYTLDQTLEVQRNSELMKGFLKQQNQLLKREQQPLFPLSVKFSLSTEVFPTDNSYKFLSRYFNKLSLNSDSRREADKIKEFYYQYDSSELFVQEVGISGLGQHTFPDEKPNIVRDLAWQVSAILGILSFEFILIDGDRYDSNKTIVFGFDSFNKTLEYSLTFTVQRKDNDDYAIGALLEIDQPLIKANRDDASSWLDFKDGHLIVRCLSRTEYAYAHFLSGIHRRSHSILFNDSHKSEDGRSYLVEIDLAED